MQRNYVAGYDNNSLPYNISPQFIQANASGYYGGESSQPTKYSRNAAKVLGSIQLIIGIICASLNIAILCLNYNYAEFPVYIGYGIWGGSFFFVAGLLQILSSSKVQNRDLIVATMVMSILAACVSGVVLALGIIEAVIGSLKTYYFFGNIFFSFGIILAILAFIEGVLSITTSALCCGAVCCNSQNKTAGYPSQFVGNQPADYNSGPRNW